MNATFPLLVILVYISQRPIACAEEALLPAGDGRLAAETSKAARASKGEVIPWDKIGAKAGSDYQGNGLSVAATEAGAWLHCVFQRLDGEATREGLWLVSTVTNQPADRFRVVAKVVRGRALAPQGTVAVTGQTVRFARPGLVEEYTVSMDGVRQDFVVTDKPAGGGELKVQLGVTGAWGQSTSYGTQLVLKKSGRKIAYSRLCATDAKGKELPARIEAEQNSEILDVVVNDAAAVYPVRIDPTFSDVNWISMGGVDGTDGQVMAAVIDDMGNLYIGGSFTLLGNTIATNIAQWNGSAWSPLGSGMGGSYNYHANLVSALAVSGDTLYAGGNFTTAGGNAASYIAQWNGSAWSPLGSGMNGSVGALAASGGTLYAGGNFTTAGGNAASYIAQWNGSSWSPLGSGMGGVSPDNSPVEALAVSGGTLYAGGRFTTAGGNAANNIAQWNGIAWSPLGSGMNGLVKALAASGGILYAGANFTTAGGNATYNIAQWNGSAWSPLGSGMGSDPNYYDNGEVSALAVSGGTLYAGGSITTAGGNPANYIAQWNGSSWSPLGSGLTGNLGPCVNALAVSGGTLYAGGWFTAAGGNPANNIAQWNGSSWSPLALGMGGQAICVYALAVSGDTLYAGGNFTSAVAQWNGNSWLQLGSGVDSQYWDSTTESFGNVYSLAVSGGTLYAGGFFTNAGGNPANNIAQWNGNSWSPLGSGIGDNRADSFVYVLAVSGGTLYAGGSFTTAGGNAANNIAQWNGSGWSPLGLGMSGYVYALAVSGGTLYAGGRFTTAGGNAANNIAQWNGSGWSPLGLGMSGYVYALAVSGGTLYAGGSFWTAGGNPANYIAQWNGSAWSPVGSGMNGFVEALMASGGRLYAGGSFTTAGGIAANNIAQWNGSAWSPLGSGMNDLVEALTASGGTLYAGGSFTTAGGKVSVSAAEATVGASSPAICNLDVAPLATVFFGSLETGGTIQRTFAISNSGQSTITGTASVPVPFSIVGSCDYTLAPGQSQGITVQYAPTTAEKDSDYVTFTSGAVTVARQVTGTSYNDPTLTTGSISGQVTDSGTAEGVNGAAVTVVGPGANAFNGGSSPNTLTGIIGGQSGMYVISGLAPNVNYDVIVTPPLAELQQLYVGESDGVAVVAGQTTTANVQLIPIPAANQSPTLTPQQTPVVFVRGFGLDESWVDNDPSSEWGYWSTMRNALLAAGFVNIWDCNQPDDDPTFPVNGGNGHVINGENGIDENAQSLEYFVGQKVLQFKQDNGFYPPVINIIAHSMGGLITREAINLTGLGLFSYYDPSSGQLGTVAVNKVVMLATPQCGSPVADLAVKLHPFDNFLAGSWQSTQNLTESYMISDFNQTFRNWPATVSLYLFSATGGPNAMTDGLSSLLWRSALKLGSDYINTVNLPLGSAETINDGVVTQASANGVVWSLSATWPPLQSHTSVVLNPIQSVTDGDFGESLDHLSLLNDFAVAQWVVSTLANPNATPTSLESHAISVAHSGATKMDLTNDSTSLPIQTFEQANGITSPGTTNQILVVCDASTKLIFQMICNDTNAVLTLLDPSGIPVNAASPESNTNVEYSAGPAISNALIETYAIGEPTNGTWRAIIDGAKVTSTNASYILTVSGDSGTSLIPQSESEFSTSEDAVITCTLADVITNPPTSVLNATITATVLFPDGSRNTLTLYDDGLHNDGAANDGVYAVVMTNIQEAGYYSVFYQCQATNDQGQALQRVATGAFSVSSGDANLVGDPVYQTVDTNGDGVADFLVVQCWVNASIAGTYAVSCDLVDSTEIIRFSESAEVTVSSSGTTTVPLIFNLAEFPTLTGSTNYHVENLQLFEITPTGLSWLDAYHGSSTITISSVPSAPTIASSTNLPLATAGIAYSTTLQAMGGTTPYTWSIVAGTLPIGLSLGSGGTISGIPSEAATSVFTIQATANNGLSSTNAFSLETDPGFPPVGSFLAGPINGVAPLLVTFTNTSSGIISNQIWMFGDGNISSATNPIHTYTNAGVFTVSLTLVGPGGTNTVIQTNLITVTIPQTGSLQVTISPPGAISSGAQWQVDGGQSQNSGATVSNLSVGNHTVGFNTINGWTTPANQTVSVAANSTATAIGTYTQQYGSLQVTISPASAITAGAKWQVDGGTFQNSGATDSNLSVGSHTVSFNTINGWTTPANQTVSVAANSTATAIGTYAQQYGSVQVTISPASAITAGAKWQVDGGTSQNSGATVSNLSVGSHTVSFTTISGWTTPSNQTVSLSANSTAIVSGTYVAIAQTGSLQVTISPVSAITAGAKWQVDGGTLQSSGAIVSNLSVGNHTVGFNTINGWTTPADQTVSVSANSTATANGTYVAQTGSLQVTISPATAITSGAKWQVDGGTLQSSGAIVSNLSVGNHTVGFNTINGWMTPADQTVSVSANSTAAANGTYVAQTGSLQVTITPASAITDGAKWQVDGGSFQHGGAMVTNLSVSNHTVSFSTISGWTTPANQTVAVSANSTTTASGTYVISGPTGFLQITIGPASAIAAGAQWQVDGGTSQKSSTMASNLSVGHHTVSFNTVSGWTTPANQAVSIKAKSVAKAKGTYAFAAHGIYNGLFMQTNATEETAGMLSGLDVTASGAYTGKLLIGGSTHAISGGFNVSGQASNFVQRTTKLGGPLTLEMTLNWDDSPPNLTGTVAGNNGAWTANLTNELALKGPSSAEYTAWVAPDGTPPGYGYMLITNHAGAVTLSVTLADGTSFSQAVPLSGAGDLPVYGNLYSSKGLVLGWIGLESGSPFGNLTWIKPASRSTALYTNGFTNQVVVEGSPWIYRSPHTAAINLPLGKLDISGGNLSLPLSFDVVVSNNDALVKLPGSPTNSLTGSINPKTGLLTITFGNGAGKATTAGKGAVLQNTTNAAGFFLGKTNAGVLMLQP